jgi:hypothetical protein
MQDSYLNRLLGEDERIVHTARRHWLVLAGEIASEVVLTLALIVLVSLLVFLPFGGPLWAMGYGLLVFPAASLLRDLLVWLNRKFVVTTRRVIHVEGIFSKDVTDSSLEKVNDVKMVQSALGRIFDYGDVEILTASELGASRFARIAEPVKFKTAMLNAKHRLEQGQGDGDLAIRPAPAPAAPPAPPPSLADRVYAATRQGTPPGDGAPAGSHAPAPAAPDIPALLRQLDELRQQGVLTEAEFQNKKAQLLSRL